MTGAARLAASLCDALADEPLAAELELWLGDAPRFRAFVETHHDKVRKKLRVAADAAGRRDVRAELLVARLLLDDRRLELAFEPYGSRVGGPDFRVTMRGQPAFNLEVTRLRGEPGPAHLAGQLLTKLRQLPPSVPNAVLIAVDLPSLESVKLAAAVREVLARADAKDEAFFAGRGFEGSRDFYRRFMRLGGAFLLSEAAPATGRATLWVNPSARIALPARAARACLELLRA
jgi:hypothetical protein